MKLLPNREISEDEYQETYSRLDRKFCGSEASVILNFRPGIARKVFLNTFQVEKKIPKLAFLYQNEEKLDNNVKIISTVSYKGKFFSYDMAYDSNDVPFNSRFLCNKIPYLSLSRKKLDHFYELSIVYGDVKADNILVNQKTGILSFCDMDNIQIGEQYPIDMVSDYLESFVDENGFVEKSADYYMHSLMTLSVLESNAFEYYEILQMIEDGYKFPYLEKSAQGTLEKMNDAIFYYSGDYLVDYVKKK